MGANHSCVAFGQAEAWCWGSARVGGVGRTRPSGRFTAGAERVALDSAVSDLTVSLGATCASLTDGTFTCWTLDWSTEGADLFVSIPFRHAREMRSNSAGGCGRDDDGWFCLAILSAVDGPYIDVQRLGYRGSVLAVATQVDVLLPTGMLTSWNDVPAVIHPMSAVDVSSSGLALDGTGRPVVTPRVTRDTVSEGEAAAFAAVGALTGVSMVEGIVPHLCVLQSGHVSCTNEQPCDAATGTGCDPGSIREVPLVAPAITIAANVASACAVLEDLSVWCWGANSEDALGDGTGVSSWDPVRVANIPSSTD